MSTYLSKDGLSHFWSVIKTKFLKNPANTPSTGDLVIYNGSTPAWNTPNFNKKLYTTTIDFIDIENKPNCVIKNDLITSSITFDVSDIFARNVVPIFLNSNSNNYIINFLSAYDFPVLTGYYPCIKFIGLAPANTTVHFGFSSITGVLHNLAIDLNCCTEHMPEGNTDYIARIKYLVNDSSSPLTTDNFLDSVLTVRDYYNVAQGVDPSIYYTYSTDNYYSSKVYVSTENALASSSSCIILTPYDAGNFQNRQIDIIFSKLTGSANLPYDEVFINVHRQNVGTKLS